MVMRLVVMAVAVWFSAIPLMSQNSIDIFAVSGRLGLPTPYDPELPEKAQESGALVNLKIPVILSEKSIWFSNFSYTWSRVSNGLTLPAEVVNPIDLHGFVLQTGLVQRIDEKRAFQLLFVPRFMSDFIAPGKDAWQFGAVGLYANKFGENLLMRFGVMYNQELSGPLLVPLIDIDWKFAPHWSITGLIPIYGKVNYKLNEKLTTGISMFGLVTSYALSDPLYNTDYMERTSIDLTLFAKWNLAGNIFMEGRIGYALARNYNQYDKSEKVDLKVSIVKFGDNRGEPINPVFSDGGIAELRLVYSLNLPD